MRVGAVIRSWRVMREISLRDAASQIGTTAPTLCRLEAGKPVDGATLAKVLAWLLAPNTSRQFSDDATRRKIN